MLETLHIDEKNYENQSNLVHSSVEKIARRTFRDLKIVNQVNWAKPMIYVVTRIKLLKQIRVFKLWINYLTAELINY